MPRRKKPRLQMSEEAKRKLKESGRFSYYNQDAWIQELEEEDPQVKVNQESSASNASLRKLQPHLDANLHSDSSDMDSDQSDDSDTGDVSDCIEFCPVGNQIWDCEQLCDVVNSAAVCRSCKTGTLQLITRKSRGWSTEVALIRDESGCRASDTENAKWMYTSKSLGSGGSHVINRALTLAMRVIGKGRSGAVMLSSLLNLPKPLHQTNWARHTREWCETIRKVATDAFREACLRAKKSQILLQLSTDGAAGQDIPAAQVMETVVDIPVSLDGSWKSRHMSQHGMVAAISADTGEVVDCYYACSVCSQ